MAAIPVLRVSIAGSLALSPVVQWFAEISRNRWVPEFIEVASIELPALARYRIAGGLDPRGDNSQALVAEVLDRLDADQLRALARLSTAPIVVVPSGFRPHCWHLAEGGRRLASSGAVHRYALLPEDATLGAIVHELGHLFFDWPDLANDSGLGSECLMARGALLPEPAPPCAVLRLRAGWMPPLAPERAMRVADLELGEAVKIGERVIERRRNPDRLLVLLDRARPILLRRIELRREDLERPLLAVARFR